MTPNRTTAGSPEHLVESLLLPAYSKVSVFIADQCECKAKTDTFLSVFNGIRSNLNGVSVNWKLKTSSVPTSPGRYAVFFFSELYWGKDMVAYTMPQQRKKEESERLRGERDQIKFIDLGFERWQVVRFRKARGRQTSHKLHVLGMNDDLWDRVCGLGSGTWKGCE